MIGVRTARRILPGVAALVLVAHAGAVAGAAPARCGGRAGRQLIELCRVTVLEGSTSGYVRVHLSKDSAVNADTFEVSGSGFGGFVLVEDRPEFDGTTILGGRVAAGSEVHEFACCKFTATPGTYRLYLLTDSAATRVTLTLDGQPAGSTTVSPQRKTRFEVGKTTPSTAGDKAGEYYAAGTTGTITSAHGLSFAGLWVDSSARVLSQTGRCLYFGEVPADAFAPGCPWATADRLWSQGGGVAPSTSPVTSGIYGMTWPLPKGTYSHGVYSATAGLADGAVSLTGWLNFD